MADKKSFLSGLSLGKKKKDEDDVDSSMSNYDPNQEFVPALPSVNLIPASVIEGYQLQALQARFVKGIGVLVVVVLALWGVLFGLEKISEMRVAQAQEEAAAYGSQVQALQPYADYRDSVQGKRTTIGEKMATEVNTGEVVDELKSIASSSGVSLSESVQISVSTGEEATGEGSAASGGTCQSSDPFTSQPSIGCITFTGEGPRGDVADFIEELNSHDNFNNTFIPETTSGESQTFNGTVNYTGGFLTNAYADLLVDETGEETEVPNLLDPETNGLLNEGEGQ